MDRKGGKTERGMAKFGFRFSVQDSIKTNNVLERTSIRYIAKLREE